MILTIILVVLGIYIEKRFSPRVKRENGYFFFHYTAQKGARNKQKIF
jgi:hypothetical protein